MERKVIKQGPNTLMISLPIKWAKKNKISKGDSINLIEEYNSLIITKGIEKEEIKKVEIEIKEGYKDTLIRGIIGNLHKKGYDLIELNITSDDVISSIQKAVNNVMGLEIIDQKKNKITIKNISLDLVNEFDNYLRKTFFMIIEMARIVREDCYNSNYVNEHQVKQLKDNIGKFSDVCKRAITKNDVYPEKNKFLYLIIWVIEKIANEYIYIYRRIAAKKPKLEKNVLNLIDETNGYFKAFYEAFYKIKKFDFDDLYKLKDNLYYKEAYSIIEKTKNPVIVMHLANIIRLTYSCINPLIGIEY